MQNVLQKFNKRKLEMMDKDVKEDWIEALRSGEHVQGLGCLERGNGAQCCLGVLCEILDLPYRVLAKGDRVYLGIEGGISMTGHLPYKVRSELNISAEESTTLTKLNDNGVSFEEIADYIEVYL